MIREPETVQEALFNAIRAFGSSRPYRDARLEAELLLARALNLSRASLLARLGDPLDPGSAIRFAAMVARRAQAEPVAYILGHQEFYGLDFLVDRRVLIPRPETELLVERALEILEHASWLRPTVVDVGTGSGAIAIAIAARVPRARVIAADLSREALEVARLNAERLGVAGRIEFRQGDLLDPVTERIDLLLANLPYIPLGRERELPREIRDYEPRIALMAGLDGLALNRRLLEQAPRHVTRGAHLLIELSEEQGQVGLEVARTFFPFAAVRLFQDLEGLDRMIEVQV